MDISFQEFITHIGQAVDLFGVVVMLTGGIVVSAYFVRRVRQRVPITDAFTSYRQGIGRSILLGLELLVAADIIRTVAVEPTFASVGVLAAIVLIRTFLSFTLELEITGRFPWTQARRTSQSPSDQPPAS